MQLIRDLATHHPTRPLALAIGNFDGLHAGHRAVIARMQEVATAEQLVPSVLTFTPHPRRYFAPATPDFLLQRPREKFAMLRALGVERVFALRFNTALANLSASEFLTLLRERMGVQAVITGANFTFGKGRGGDIAMLNAWAAEHGVRSEQVPPVMREGEICSSSAVRGALQQGAMPHAAALLGRPYCLTGRVQKGDQRGRELGYPTANILPMRGLLLPRYGIYAVQAQMGARRIDGVASLGVRPMFALAQPLLEVHLFDVAEDLYGMRLEVAFRQYLRAEKHFDSLAALVQQMGKDAQQARQWLKEQA